MNHDSGFTINDHLDICGNIAGIFSGLLAFGFDHLSGAGGLSGWQWYENTSSMHWMRLG